MFSFAHFAWKAACMRVGAGAQMWCGDCASVCLFVFVCWQFSQSGCFGKQGALLLCFALAGGMKSCIGCGFLEGRGPVT